MAIVNIQRIGSLPRRALTLYRRIVAGLDQELAEIAAVQQSDEGFGRPVETLHDVLAVFQLATAHQRSRHRAILAKTLPLVTDDEALDFEPLAYCRRQIRTGARFDIVVFRHHAAHHHAPEIVEPREHRLLHRTADILPIDVDAFRTGAVERGPQICRAMVDASVEAELAFDIATFVGAAGNTNDPRAAPPAGL